MEVMLSGAFAPTKVLPLSREAAGEFQRWRHGGLCLRLASRKFVSLAEVRPRRDARVHISACRTKKSRAGPGFGGVNSAAARRQSLSTVGGGELCEVVR